MSADGGERNAMGMRGGWLQEMVERYCTDKR